MALKRNSFVTSRNFVGQEFRQLSWAILLFHIQLMEVLMSHTACVSGTLVRVAGRLGSAASIHLSTFKWPLSGGTQTSYLRLWGPRNSRSLRAFYELAPKAT